MARIDVYEKFPVYVELRDYLSNTSDGRDLLAILYRRKLQDGYLLKSTDRFYIDLGSKTYIRKLPNGKWYYTALSDGRPFSEAFYDNIPEMVKDVWIKGILKRTPEGVKKADLKDWLQKPDCPVIGKELDIQEIIVAYLESLGEGYFIKNVDSIFDSKEWVELFNFLGIKKIITNDGLLRPTLSLGKLLPVQMTDPSYNFWLQLLLPFFEENEREVINSLITHNPGFIIKCIPKMGRVKLDFWNGGIEITVGARTKEELEKTIIEQIIAYIKRATFILPLKYEDNPISKLVVSLLEGKGVIGTWVKSISEFVLGNPTSLEHIPSPYREAVMEEAGISKELEGTLKYSKEIGLL